MKMKLFENIFNNSPYGVFITDLKGNFINVNKKATELTGFTYDELLKMHFLDVSHKDYINLAKRKFKDILNNKELNFEAKYKDKYGRTGWWKIKAINENDYLVGFVDNITIEKENIETVSKNSEFYLSVLKYSFDGFCLLNRDGEIKDINSVYLKKLGYKKSEIVGKKIYETDFVENKIITKGRIEKIIKNKKLKFATKHKSIHDNIIDLEISTYYDETNELIYVFLKDLTEELKKIKEIEKLQNLMSNTLEVANGGYWVYDFNSDELKWDEKLYEIHEIPKDYNIIQGDWLDYIYDLDKPRVLAKIKKFNDNGGVFNDKYRILTKKGNIRYIDATAYLQNDENGNPSKLSGINIDRTSEYEKSFELEDLNQRFEIAVESGNIGVWDYDYHNNKLIWNDAMFRIFEVEKDEFSYTIQDLEKLVHPDDLAGTNKNLYNAIRFNTLYDTTFRIITPKGNLKYIDAYGKLIKDNEGKPKKISGVNIDISESILKQQELQKAKEIAEENDKLKTAFLHNISHEIRTPLNGIIGFTHLLTEEGISFDEKKEFESLIKSSANRLIQVIDDIIDLSMVETGQIEIKKQLFDLNGVIDDVYSLYKDRIEKKGLKLRYTYDSSKTVNIYSDSKYLLKILLHLLHNSLKFTQTGEIEIAYVEVDKKVRFMVRDTGIGIDDNIKERIYDRFVQGDNEVNRSYEGAGLGLTLCKELIEKLGGNIWFETEIGKGTKFYFELPLRENMEDLILIAEDNDTSYTFLKLLLKKYGYNSLRALNGKETIEMCDSHNISLILMDMKMPILSGYEATEIIRKKYDTLPIIAVTADALQPLIDKALKVGCNSHIPKPIDADILIKEIKKYV